MIGLSLVGLVTALLWSLRTAPVDVEAEFFDYDSGELMEGSVCALFADSRDTIWISTLFGLASFDGDRWEKIPIEVGLFGSPRGPDVIAEDPSGTVWFGGTFGLARLAEGELVPFEPRAPLTPDHLHFENSGGIWALAKASRKLWRFDGQRWTVMLERPHIGGLLATHLTGFAVDEANGVVWVGGKSPAGFPESEGPWRSSKPRWREGGSQGPPVAALYRFDGKSWRAFGRQHGLSCEICGPSLQPDGSVVFRSDRGEFALGEGDRWARVGANPPPRHPGLGRGLWCIESDSIVRWEDRASGVVRRFKVTADGRPYVIGEDARLVEDRRGWVWIGVGKRVLRFKVPPR